jgi:hypothetical protein
MALIKYPSTKAQPAFQKKPTAVLVASPNKVQNSIENRKTIPLFLGITTGSDRTVPDYLDT